MKKIFLFLLFFCIESNADIRGYIIDDLIDGTRRIELRSRRPPNTVTLSPRFEGGWVTDIRWVKIIDVVFDGYTYKKAIIDSAQKDAADSEDVLSKATKDAYDSGQKAKLESRITMLKNRLNNFDSLTNLQKDRLLKVLTRTVLVMMSRVEEE